MTPSFRDVELISAYLDGTLPQAEAARLQTRIDSDPELASIYEQLSQARAVLRKLPQRRAPRNFTLTRQMAGVKAPTPRVFPVFRFASVFASLLLMLTFAANAVQPAFNAQLQSSEPLAYGMGGSGGGSDPSIDQIQPELANPEAPVLEAPLPEATMGALEMAPALPADAAPTPTGEEMRVAAEPTPAAKAAPGEMQDTAPLETTPAEAVAAEPQPPLIPGSVQVALLVVALLAGATAWFVNWQANQKFAKK